MPTAINKIANKALYSEAFNFSEIFKPTCKPIIDPNNKKETNTRSTDLNWMACATTTNPVIKIVTNSDVPGINLVGMPIKYIIAGTIKKAPPIPMIDANNPTTNPKMIGVNALSYSFDLLNRILKGRPCIQ